MGEVHRLDTAWHGPLEVNRVLAGARAAKLENVLVIGWKGGDVSVFSDFPHKADVLWLLERVKADLLAERW